MVYLGRNDGNYLLEAERLKARHDAEFSEFEGEKEFERSQLQREQVALEKNTKEAEANIERSKSELKIASMVRVDAEKIREAALTYYEAERVKSEALEKRRKLEQAPRGDRRGYRANCSLADDPG